MRTAPVKYSAGPLLEDCDPLRLISIFRIPPRDCFTWLSISQMLEPIRKLRTLFSLVRQLCHDSCCQHAIEFGQRLKPQIPEPFFGSLEKHDDENQKQQIPHTTRDAADPEV